MYSVDTQRQGRGELITSGANLHLRGIVIFRFIVFNIIKGYIIYILHFTTFYMAYSIFGNETNLMHFIYQNPSKFHVTKLYR